MTQTEDYIKKEGTKELNNIVKTSNSYTIPTVSYNANYKTWSVKLDNYRSLVHNI